MRRLPPELSHNLSLRTLNILHGLGILSTLASPPPADPVELFGLRFANRLGIAAGMDKNGDCIDALGALGVGFVEIGTVTPRPCSGNAGQRVRRLRAERAVVNRLGFPNKGLEHVRRRLQRRRWQGVVGVNIGKQPDTDVERAAEDYLLLMRELWTLADYFTVNISSPNSPGLRGLQDSQHLLPLLQQLLDEREVLSRRHGATKPLLLKLSADLSRQQVKAIAAVLAQAPVDALVLSNTTTDHPHGEGGLSGPPLAAKSRRVQEDFRSLLPEKQRPVLIACGGIDSGEEAVARRSGGAELLQLYTGMVYSGPSLLQELGQALCSVQQSGSGKVQSKG